MADDSPYQVIWSHQAHAAAAGFAPKARGLGLGEELARILKVLQDRLENEPLSLGEVYRSRGVIREHLAVLDFVSLDVAVDTQRRLVYVRKCHALSPLDS